MLKPPYPYVDMLYDGSGKGAHNTWHYRYSDNMIYTDYDSYVLKEFRLNMVRLSNFNMARAPQLYIDITYELNLMKYHD